MYASDAAIQGHLKLKHKSGKKSQREAYAMEIFEALKFGQENIPTSEFNIPPGFVDVIFLSPIFSFSHIFRLSKSTSTS
jgi:hypothetical protein